MLRLLTFDPRTSSFQIHIENNTRGCLIAAKESRRNGFACGDPERGEGQRSCAQTTSRPRPCKSSSCTTHTVNTGYRVIREHVHTYTKAPIGHSTHTASPRIHCPREFLSFLDQVLTYAQLLLPCMFERCATTRQAS